jgi:hypothetical protein
LLPCSRHPEPRICRSPVAERRQAEASFHKGRRATNSRGPSSLCQYSRPLLRPSPRLASLHYSYRANCQARAVRHTINDSRRHAPVNISQSQPRSKNRPRITSLLFSTVRPNVLGFANVRRSTRTKAAEGWSTPRGVTKWLRVGATILSNA